MLEWLVSSWFEKVMKLLVGGSLLDKVHQGMRALMCAHCLLGAHIKEAGSLCHVFFTMMDSASPAL